MGLDLASQRGGTQRSGSGCKSDEWGWDDTTPAHGIAVPGEPPRSSSEGWVGDAPRPCLQAPLPMPSLCQEPDTAYLDPKTQPSASLMAVCRYAQNRSRHIRLCTYTGFALLHISFTLCWWHHTFQRQ